ncbi:MAG: M23 family metallopeptidase [Candidatus Moranbacteria bacterium]|nr:M23 family metallopeptidase [Candidatus Moranbacteria bacterium]
MKNKTYILIIIGLVTLVVAGFLYVKKANAPVNNSQPTTNNLQQTTSSLQPTTDNNKNAANNNQKQETIDPLDNALARITKKPFGIYVNPKNSPVDPERFAGYHSAVDLEATIEEQNINVPVIVFCDGKLLVARTASGYGGVAVQSCVLDGQDVTIVYGHIDLKSMNVKVGDALRAGDFLANLGAGFSNETDGERKHLHLGIHKGNAINILGYVQSKNELSAWIDPSNYLD